MKLGSLPVVASHSPTTKWRTTVAIELVVVGTLVAPRIIVADLFTWLDIAQHDHDDLTTQTGVGLTAVIDPVARPRDDRPEKHVLIDLYHRQPFLLIQRLQLGSVQHGAAKDDQDLTTPQVSRGKYAAALAGKLVMSQYLGLPELALAHLTDNLGIADNEL